MLGGLDPEMPADGHQPGTALEAWKAGHSPRVEATET